MIYRLETSQAGSNITEVYVSLRANPKVLQLVLPQIHAYNIYDTDISLGVTEDL